MSNKFLSRKVFLNPKGDEDKDNLVIEYYLIDNVTQGINEEKKGYGIEVVKKNNGIEKEIECIEYYSGDLRETEEFLEVLAVNEVTPISVRYILEDILE